VDRLCLQGPAGRVALRRKSFEVLRYLAEHPDRVVTKQEVLDAVWPNVTVTDESLTQCISEVRRAIGDESQRIIKTVPRRGYFIDVPSDITAGADPAPASATAENPSLALPLPDRPSIAVLPFTNMSGDRDQEYFVDGVTEDIITALSKWRWFLVIARNSSFAFKGKPVSIKQIGEELGARYVVEGSVRRAGSRVRITAQLIEARTERHIWADRYDRDISDVFAVQDDIAQHVVVAVDPAIRVSEMDSAKRKPPENMDAWDHFLRGGYHFHMYTKRDSLLALDHLRRAIQIDPRFAAAHARLALAHTYAASLGRAGDVRETLGAALNSAKTAVALDSFDASAHAAASYAQTYMHQHDSAVHFGRHAVELNTNYHLAYFVLGIALTFAGAPLEALDPLESAIRLSPRDPAVWFIHNTLALAHYTAKQYEAGNDAADQALAERARYGGAKIAKVAALVHLRRITEARALLAEVPSIAFSQLPHLCPFRDPLDFEHLLVALEQAGLRPKISDNARQTFADLQLEKFR
jgi:TolB-like protein